MNSGKTAVGCHKKKTKLIKPEVTFGGASDEIVETAVSCPALRFYVQDTERFFLLSLCEQPVWLYS